MKLEQIPEPRRTDEVTRRPRPVLVDREEIAPVMLGPSRGWRALTLIAGLAGGVVLMIFGAIALSRGDLDGSWNEPIVEVNGWPHSPMLGLLEIIGGAAMVIVSLSSVGEFLVGSIIAGFGVVALVEPAVLDDRLSIDTGHSWLLVAVGGVALFSALTAYLGRRAEVVRRTSIYATDHVDITDDPYV
jgi:hypothetical protein